MNHYNPALHLLAFHFSTAASLAYKPSFINIRSAHKHYFPFTFVGQIMVELGLSLNVLSFNPAQRPGLAAASRKCQRVRERDYVGIKGLCSYLFTNCFPFLLFSIHFTTYFLFFAQFFPLRQGKERNKMVNENRKGRENIW